MTVFVNDAIFLCNVLQLSLVYITKLELDIM